MVMRSSRRRSHLIVATDVRLGLLPGRCYWNKHRTDRVFGISASPSPPGKAEPYPLAWAWDVWFGWCLSLVNPSGQYCVCGSCCCFHIWSERYVRKWLEANCRNKVFIDKTQRHWSDTNNTETTAQGEWCRDLYRQPDGGDGQWW